VLFTIRMPGGIDPPQVAVLDLTTGHRTILIRGGSQPEYIDSGHLVYALDGTLRAVRFDARTLTVEGEPVPVIEQVRTQLSGAAEFSASRQGALVYVPGGAAVTPVRSLVWVTRHGQETPITAPSRTYMIPRLSPDGTRVALYIGDQDQGIWIWDLARRTLTRLTVTPAFNSHPVWTPDSRRVIFASSPAGNANVFSQSADTTGTVERLSTSPNDQRPNSMTPDGTQLIVREVVPTSGADLRVLPMGGSSTAAGRRQTEPLVHTRFAEQNGDISPDGHWLAYESDDSGQFQIVVRPFPNVDGGRWTISPSGGTKPVWARSGRELFYLNGANALTVVSVHTGPTFSADTPTELFEGPYFAAGEFDRNYDVSPDGQRFLMIKYAAGGGNQADTPASMIVVVNWVEELKARVPGK
jgi:serine/threonine-protein kinase